MEKVQNLIQEEIGKLLKIKMKIKGKHHNPIVGQRVADSLSSGRGHSWAWSWPDGPSLLVLVNSNPLMIYNKHLVGL